MSRVRSNQISDHNENSFMLQMFKSSSQQRGIEETKTNSNKYCVNHKPKKIEMSGKEAYQSFENHAKSMRDLSFFMQT